VPLHFILPPCPTLAPTTPSSGGGAVPPNVVARGGADGWWGPCGCQAWGTSAQAASLPGRLTAFSSSISAFSPHRACRGATRCNWDSDPPACPQVGLVVSQA